MLNESSADPVERERQRGREMRAAVDVMFEALSHIQASLESSSEEKRRKTYQTFKEALYDRFEHLVEERKRQEQEASWQEPQPEESQLEGTESEEDSDGDDTLDKMWPAIADKAS